MSKTPLSNIEYTDLGISAEFAQRLGELTKEGIAILASDGLQVRTNVMLGNSRTTAPAHFVDSRGMQMIWQTNAANQMSDFQDCIFTECSWLECPDDAEIHFYGHCILGLCQFKPTQKVFVHGDTEFHNCSNVNLVLDTTRTDTYNLTVEATSLDLSNITSSWKLMLHQTGGSLILPQTASLTQQLDCYGVDITLNGSTALYTNLRATGCTITAGKVVYIRELVGSVITFTAPGSQAEIAGAVCSSNEIRANSQCNVYFTADIVIGNRINTGGNIVKGSSVAVSSANYNGLTVV